MAENTKFGGGRGAQFGDRILPGSGDAGHCGQCEAMLADVLDGALSVADQALFDAHMASCGPCSDMLADAKRGAAWLEMLREPRPEPPAELLERILAQTSGAVLGHAAVPAPTSEAVFLGAPVARGPARFGQPVSGQRLFAQRVAEPLRRAFSFHGLLQPRLAMTAAMAFFSIALTMNLTGVRLGELHARDLKPSSIKQGFYSANARVVRYYEGLRVVYELESRVHDIESDSDANGTTDPRAPAAAPAGRAPGQPVDSPRNSRPEPEKPRPAAPGPGSSRRENLVPSAGLVAAREISSLSLYRTSVTWTNLRIASPANDGMDVPKVRALA